jgi:hypothetical protein
MHNIITFVFIFITWWCVYNFFFSYVIMLSFVGSIAVMFYLIHVVKKAKKAVRDKFAWGR